MIYDLIYSMNYNGVVITRAWHRDPTPNFFGLKSIFQNFGIEIRIETHFFFKPGIGIPLPTAGNDTLHFL